MKRKTFVAREDLLTKINEMAKKSGRSQFDLINEIFELTIQAVDKDVNIKIAIEEQSFLKRARERGFILSLENLLSDTAELAYDGSKERATRAWHNAGIWFAKRYSQEDTEDPIHDLRKDLKTYFWNVPELDLIHVGTNVTLRAMSPRFSEPHALLFSSFLEGTLEALGYRIDGREVSNGSVRLTAIRK